MLEDCLTFFDVTVVFRFFYGFAQLIFITVKFYCLDTNYQTGQSQVNSADTSSK